MLCYAASAAAIKRPHHLQSLRRLEIDQCSLTKLALRRAGMSFVASQRKAYTEGMSTNYACLSGPTHARVEPPPVYRTRRFFASLGT